MTKVTILGETQGAEPENKKIEFVKIICNGKFGQPACKPDSWDNIELISRGNFEMGMDIMFAYGTDRSLGIVYLGHFNDGIV